MARINERRTVGKESILYALLAKLALEGRNRFSIPQELIDDEVWKNLSIHIEKIPDTQEHIVILTLKGIRGNIQDAEYEIIEENKEISSTGNRITALLQAGEE